MAAEELTIAYLTSLYARASDSFVRGEVRAMRARGHRVHTFSIRRPPSSELVTDEIRAEHDATEYILDAGVRRLAVAAARAAVRWPGRMARAVARAMRLGTPGLRGRLWPFAYLVEAALLAERLDALRVQHLHNHIAGNAATVAMLASTLSGVPYSLTVHGSHELEHPGAAAIDLSVEHAKFVVGVSGFTRAQVLRFARVEDWPKVHVIRCGVTDSFMDRAAVPLPATPRLLAVGRLDAVKGYPVLVDAVELLVEQGVPVSVTIVGDGPLRPALERQIEALGIGGTIRLAGWRSAEEIASLVERCRAVVIASFSEGLPIVAMESLALRRPVIATTVGGLPELVRDGVSGWLVAPGSAEELAGAMRAALEVPSDEIERRGREGRALVAEMHDGRRSAARLEGLMRADGV